jgi:glycosyltransferase involved in cell wall biosynthesis
VRLVVTTEEHLSRCAGTQIHCGGPSKYASWARYLEAFDEVVVVARVAQESRPRPEQARADGPCVSFWPLPDFHGPWQYLHQFGELRKQVRAAVASCDAYILRVPGLVSRLVWCEIQRVGKTCALEVVADPWDGLGPGTSPSISRPFFRRAAARQMKRMCQTAAAIHYVTEDALQHRYPPGENAYAVGFSDVVLDAAFASADAVEARLRRLDELPVSGKAGTKRLRIGFLGSMSSLYKAPDVLLRAAFLCRQRGLDFELAIAGEGRCRGPMQALALRLGIADRVQFLGQLPFGDSVFRFLDSVDLFVMPSRAEGLPRAMLEAMARGCPCIGSDVGGIPELLVAEDLAPAGDAQALARKIMQVAVYPKRLKAMSVRNLERAARFTPEKLRAGYRDFCSVVRIRSEESTRTNAPKTEAHGASFVNAPH